MRCKLINCEKSEFPLAAFAVEAVKGNQTKETDTMYDGNEFVTAGAYQAHE